MIYFIHVQGGNKFQKSSIELLTKIADELKKKYEIIIVDYFSKKNFQIDYNINFISSSSNYEYREFGNWETGLIYLRSKKLNSYNQDKFEGLVVSNDTVLRHRPFDIGKFEALVEGIKISTSLEMPILFGDVSEIKCNPPYFYNSKVSKYVSTYIFFFNKFGFKLLNTFINKNINKLFLKNYKANTVLSNVSLVNNAKNYYRYIEKWLYKKNQNDIWYLHQDLNLKNFNFLKLKFKSIILEHHLSQSFIKKKGVLLDWNKFIKRNTLYSRFDFLIKKIIFKLLLIINPHR